MKLTVLVDNNTLVDHYFFAEPGLSFYIELGDKKILFDLGYSDVFLRNAFKMGILLNDVDHVVFSHGHIDHTGGLIHFSNMMAEAALEGRQFKSPEIICHPLALDAKIDDGFSFIGSPLSMEHVRSFYKVRFSKDPLWLSDDLAFLGEIQRKHPLEGKASFGKIVVDGKEVDDKLMDDSALAYRSDDGLVVITGCSHAGICNIISQAQKVFKEDHVKDVIGGFHLIDPSPDVMEFTKEFLKDNNIGCLHACHCTDLNSKISLSDVCVLHEVGAGMSFTY